MKFFHILAFATLLVGLSHCDSVDCSQIQGSPIGRIASCTSAHPFPLKVTSTVTLTMSYAFENWS
jgi:hypothetical protein